MPPNMSSKKALQFLWLFRAVFLVAEKRPFFGALVKKTYLTNRPPTPFLASVCGGFVLQKNLHS
jgi:hypothetical protein